MTEAIKSGAPIDRARVKACHLTSVHKVNDVRIFHKECATLAEAGFDVTLIGVETNVPDCGVKIVPLPDQGSRLQRVVGRAMTAYRRALATKAHIYHFHDPELLPYGLMLKRRTDAKVIFDSHECFREDVLSKDWIPSSLRVPVGHIIGAVEDFVVRRIDQVVAATPHISASFQPHAKRVVTINNYPLQSEFVPATMSSGPRNAICYVGAISFVRGIIPFLDALSFVNDQVRVHLAGPFASPTVQRAVVSHPNWRRVTFHGQVPRKQVADIYAGCFAGVVTFLPAPNHVFSQPNKLFEYMSAGVPVICSNFPVWRKLVEDEGCGLAVDPAEPSEIAAAVEKLRLEPNVSRQMADRGIRLVREKYNWTSEGRRLVEVYDALLTC